jgi:hypothetical protein
LNEVLMSAVLPRARTAAVEGSACRRLARRRPRRARSTEIAATEEQIRDMDKKAADAQAKQAGS